MHQFVDNDDQAFSENVPPIMTIKEVRELLFIGKNKIYELLGSGELKGFRIGRTWRIKSDSVEKFINEH